MPTRTPHAGDQRQEAIPLMLKARELVREVLGPKHPLNINSTVQLAWMRYRNRERAEAFRLAEEAYVQAQETPGVEEGDLFGAMHLLARQRGAKGGGSRTARLSSGRWCNSRERRGDISSSNRWRQAQLAVFCMTRRTGRAEALLGSAGAAPVLGEGHDHTLITRGNLALLYEILRRPADAMLQYLTLLRFRPLHVRALELMPDLLKQVPLSPIVVRGNPTGWLTTTNAPTTNWSEMGFDTSRGAVATAPKRGFQIRVERSS
jgi:hypothetical protein